MWPDRGEALSRTIDAEQAIEDLYTEALRRWAPTVRAAVLPALTAATEPQPAPQQQELPPDPAAVQQQQVTGGWSATTETVIVAGIALLFAATVVEAMTALGIPLPPLPDGPPPDASTSGIDQAVLAIVDGAVGDMNATDVVTAAAHIDADPALAAARDAVVADQRARAELVPAAVAAKLEQAPGPADPAAGRPELTREAVALVVDPSGPDMRDIARTAGHQAAAVQNSATLAAALAGEHEDDPLDKTWIATLDGKTRPTHWAADGQRVPLAGSFTVGGEAMSYPGDPSASAAERINCRCRMGILGRDESLPTEVDRHTERLNGRDSVALNRDGRTQSEEIGRRRAAGNVRARDTTDGVGRIASVSEESVMTDVIGGPTEAELQAFDGEPDPDFAAAVATLTAAVGTEPRLRTYDPHLFEDPKLTRPTAPSMNNETGRIFGHLAEWGHVIRGGRDVTPRNRNGYRNFHTSQVQTADGRQLSVGRLTVQGGHASTERGVTASSARAHYDDVTKAFGLVRVGEDQFGIWFSGVPAPGVDPEVFQQGMTAQLSGDWRDCEGAPLDMIAAHAVNSPGFPIYSAMTGPDGREMALVASLGPVRRQPTPTHVLASVDELKAAVAEVLDDRQRAAELVARRDAALTAAHAAVGDPPPALTPAERIAEMLASMPVPGEGH